MMKLMYADGSRSSFMNCTYFSFSTTATFNRNREQREASSVEGKAFSSHPKQQPLPVVISPTIRDVGDGVCGLSDETSEREKREERDKSNIYYAFNSNK